MFSIKSLLNSWDEFFFRPESTAGIAVFRIVWCSLLFAYLCFDIVNVQDFYGPDALLSMSTVRSQFPYPHANLFVWLGNPYEVIYVLMGVYGLALISSILGFKTRVSLFFVLICMTSFHQRNIWLLSSSELLMRTMTILLMCSPCGNSYSIDRLISKKEKLLAPWALRLMQIQISVVYLWTVWHKLKGDTWLDGTAVYYATRLEGLRNFPVPFILDNLLLIKLSTWGTLVVELLLGVLVWFKETRRPMIFIGIVFHLGIEYMMSIPFFELTMIALLMNFFTAEEHQAFVTQVMMRLKDKPFSFLRGRQAA